jgi:spore maturation protein CgeB
MGTSKICGRIKIRKTIIKKKQMNRKLNIAFFGSSIVSAYWNGAATYYRGIVKALYKMGHQVTFYEPNIYERQNHRDIEDPEYCKVIVYEKDKVNLRALLRKAQEEADIIIKTSGVGAFDEFLEEEIPTLKKKENAVIFWDVDAPATLERMEENKADAFREQVAKYDCILTYGGGKPVIKAYKKFGAKACIPIYNALDTDTHFPVKTKEEYNATLSFLGNRLPDREKRVMDFFMKPAQHLTDKKFILGGSGWNGMTIPENVDYKGHIYTEDHNAFNSSPLAVLNISRNSMATYGFSPATRVFEAAGAASCIITDYWQGIELFFEPDKEILVARNSEEVIEILRLLTPERAKEIGQAAYIKVLNQHTYRHRAKLLNNILLKTLYKDHIKLKTEKI